MTGHPTIRLISVSWARYKQQQVLIRHFEKVIPRLHPATKFQHVLDIFQAIYDARQMMKYHYIQGKLFQIIINGIICELPKDEKK